MSAILFVTQSDCKMSYTLEINFLKKILSCKLLKQTLQPSNLLPLPDNNHLHRLH